MVVSIEYYPVANRDDSSGLCKLCRNAEFTLLADDEYLTSVMCRDTGNLGFSELIRSHLLLKE